MMPKEPMLPQNPPGGWAKDLTWKLQQILRDMAKEINKLLRWKMKKSQAR